MYYFLMHKNKKVALCKEDVIIETYEEKMLPIGTEKTEDKYNIAKWRGNRSIPKDRFQYSEICKELTRQNLDITQIQRCNYELSLTDHYWLYPLKGSIVTIRAKIKLNKIDNNIPKYEEISYFTTLFGDSFIENIMSGKKIEIENIKVPDTTTNGKTKKYWVIRNNKRLLVKLNDVHDDLIAEKEVLASFVAYLINDCRKEAKKKIIPVLPYQIERGDKGKPNCCYAELFTNLNEELVTYDLIKNNSSDKTKLETLEEFIKTESTNIAGLQEYFEFMILLDYLIENNREESDIGFIVSSVSHNMLKPAPIYGNCRSFGYMTKDLTRANNRLYGSDFINVFGMTEEEQCKYIVDKFKWFSPQSLFEKSELLTEYIVSIEMHDISTQRKENIVNWLNYKLALLQHTIRMSKIQQEMEREENGYEDEYSEREEEPEDDEYSGY